MVCQLSHPRSFPWTQSASNEPCSACLAVAITSCQLDAYGSFTPKAAYFEKRSQEDFAYFENVRY